MTFSHLRLRAAVLVVLSIGANCAVADAADSEEELGTIHVIGIAPGQGATLEENLVPYNVQSATSDDFERSQVLDVTDYLNRHAAGVTINSAQGNPLQPDVNFRGFTATPLLGGSEGISVYVDGVRVNEVFGDTVNWDLIPEEAMSRVTLLSGANPIFGLNTLGGSIQIQTKNGFTDPGTHAEAYGGSFGRDEVTVSSGGNHGEWGYFLLANHFEEDGWRDQSDSRAKTFMGTLSWRGADATFDLHLNHAETRLNGNGAQSIALLQQKYDSVFTAPDRTQNSYSGITANGTYHFSEDFSIAVTVFGRQVNTRSYNGDASDFDTCADNTDILCGADDAPVLDQNGNTVSTGYNGINNIGVRKQRSVGGSLQAVWKQDWWNMRNQFVAGVDIDHGRVNYRSALEASTLQPCNDDPQFCLATQPNVGIFIPDDALAVHISDINQGLYFTDTLSATDQLAFTLSGRYNRTHTVIADSGGDDPDLDGDHTFHRFNPAVGMTYQFSKAINFYAGYDESTRAPTPVELTCASPDAPCRLPNEFLSDPDLKQVVARSVEAGFRGMIDAMHWQAGVFRTRNQHDILFQTTGGALSNEGFYANVGDTRRQGLEASLNGKMFDNRLEWFANFAHIDATFQTSFLETSVNDPNADDDGVIQVNKGDRIPGIPRNAIKLGLDYHLTNALSVGGDFLYNASQYYRGDENNLLPPIGGYGIFNLRGSYRFNDHIAVFARVDNVFDKHYYNFGTLGDASDVYDTIDDPRFLSPGMPRGAWAGVSIDF